MLSSRPLRTLAAITFSSLLISACGSTPEKTKSGFLPDYSNFQPHPEVKEAQIWLPSDGQLSDIGRYDRFMLAPIEVWYDQEESYQGISPDELKAITDYFRQALDREVGTKYPFVETAGENVAMVRLAITGLKRAAPERSALGYIPIALLVSAGRNAADSMAGNEVTVVSASLEAEIYDTRSGEKVFALIDNQTGEKTKHAKGEKSFKQISQVLDGWAKRFRTNLDKYH